MGVFSTTNRYTGFSGIDVESMVTAMMKAESLKYDKLLKQRELLLWKQQSYRDVSTKLREFQSTYLNMMNMATNMRSTASFSGLSVSVKAGGVDSSAVKATVTSSAKAGTYKLDIHKLAQAETWTSSGRMSSQIESGVDISAMDFSKMQAGDTIKIAMDNGAYKVITFSQTDINNLTIPAGDVVALMNSKLNDAFGSGVITASNVGGKLVLKPSTSGHTISIANGNVRKQEAVGFSAFTPTAGNKSFSVQLGSGAAKQLNIQVDIGDTAANVASKMNEALTEAGLGTNITVSIDSIGRMKIAAKDTNENLTLSGNLINEAMGGNVNLGYTNPLGDFGLKSNTSSQINLKQSMASAFPGFNAATSSGQFTINGKPITFNPHGTVQDFMDAVNNADAGVKMSYDGMYGQFVFESSKTGMENSISLGAGAESLLTSLGIRKSLDAQDAEFSINGGVVLSRASNTFDMYGITVQLNETTVAGQPVVITTGKDATATMDLIKKFVESYNTMLEDLKGLYTTSRSKLKGSKYDFYEPLTSEDKANMTENEIKLWEEEAKKGSLYRDPIIGGLMSDMRSMLYESVALPNGGKISLFEIGITTSSNYKDSGKLVIDEEKLKTALTERTDDVATLFTKGSDISTKNMKSRLKDEGLAERLNDLITSVAGANGSISKKAGIGSLDTSAELNKQLANMDTSIANMLLSLQRKEDNYYAKFAAMEAAVNKANQQMAALQSMFGGTA